MNPHRLTWGFTRDAPFALIAAVATVLGLLFTKERSPLPRVKETYLLLGLWAVFFLSTLFAIYPDAAWAQFIKVSKILFMTFVTLLLFQDQKKLRLLLYVIALSIGFYGLKGGIWALVTGGQYHVRGPAGSFIEGNTNLGLALNMVLPLLLLLAREEGRTWLRNILYGVFLFSIIAILVTYSRGAFLGLVVVLSVMFVKSRAKFVAMVLLAGGIVLGFSLLPQKWFGRVQTIETYQEDGSAMSRIRAWEVAYRLALDHPVLGGGFEPFSPEIYRRYLSPDLLKLAIPGTGAHSIFLQVLAEHGFTGLFLYVSLIGSTLLSLRRLSKISRKNRSLGWIDNYSEMIKASLLGFIVSGMFLSMSYFDLFYHLVGIVIILKKLAIVQEEATVAKAFGVKAAAAGRVLQVNNPQATF